MFFEQAVEHFKDSRAMRIKSLGERDPMVANSEVSFSFRQEALFMQPSLKLENPSCFSLPQDGPVCWPALASLGMGVKAGHALLDSFPVRQLSIQATFLTWYSISATFLTWYSTLASPKALKFNSSFIIINSAWRNEQRKRAVLPGGRAAGQTNILSL